MAPAWFWTALLIVAIVAAALAVLVGHVSVRAPAAALGLYRRHFPEPRHERLFLASVTFFVTFVMARGIAYAIATRAGPFANVRVGSLHVHHLVWGILVLLGVGLCWLGQIGSGAPGASRVASRVTALLYGAGAALTLDEFALWLWLADVYWSPEGRLSVQVALLFGSLLAVLTGGRSFFHAGVRESLILLGRRGV
jgi:hypothetical protein